MVVATDDVPCPSLRLFLERGLDVLVEKPIASSVAEADGLVRLARARGRILQVGHVERYNPAVEALLARVREPLFLEGHRLGLFTPRSLDLDVVCDLMIHDLQIVTDLVRRPIVDIRAAGAPILTERLDIAQSRIAFEGGCVANLTASRVSLSACAAARLRRPSTARSTCTQRPRLPPREGSAARRDRRREIAVAADPDAGLRLNRAVRAANLW